MAVDTTVQVTLPQMGESVTEGTVLEWHKQEGDRVEADETLVEISTDKVDAEIPAPVAGVLVKTFAGEGDTVTAGAVIAEIQPANGAGPVQGAPRERSGETRDGESGDGDGAPGAIVDIVTPTGGESVTEATVLEWSVKVGDAVADGQTVVELSTDKVDMELPAPAAGTITELLAQEGETVTVGQTIARMQLGAGGAAVPAPTDGQGPAAASGNGAATAAPAAPAGDGNITPLAARVAAAEGVDVSALTGTGPRGRITKQDVLDGPTAAPAAAAGSRTVLKGGAAMLARYMDESREIPTATSFRTITVTAMDARRKQL